MNLLLQIFDPSLVKKKKKKKTAFDIDAALADGAQETAATETAPTAENEESNTGDGIDLENDLDLETFGKKKRKKKKIGFNLDDVEAALPTGDDGNQDEESGAPDEESSMGPDGTFDLGMKKKKKKKTEINELLKDNKENEDIENGKNRMCG